MQLHSVLKTDRLLVGSCPSWAAVGRWPAVWALGHSVLTCCACRIRQSALLIANVFARSDLQDFGVGRRIDPVRVPVRGA
jgi:hypothetical protein